MLFRYQEVEGSNPFAPTIFPLSNLYFTRHFPERGEMRNWVHWVQQRVFVPKSQNPSSPFLLVANGMRHLAGGMALQLNGTSVWGTEIHGDGVLTVGGLEERIPMIVMRRFAVKSPLDRVRAPASP
jgi:hypothetical protein